MSQEGLPTSPTTRELERRNSRRSQHNPYEVRPLSVATAQVAEPVSVMALARAERTTISTSSTGTQQHIDGGHVPILNDAHSPIIKIERAGNTFTGVNYGHVTQTEDFNALRTLPIHPDVGDHLGNYFPDSRYDDEAYILRWIDCNNPPELVLCVLGKVGVGKSTLAKHLATMLRQDNRLAAEIFLGFALPDWSPESIIRMIARQLCGTYPMLKRAISEAIDRDVGPSVSLETRIRNFILEPIRSLCLGLPLVVLLDALDQWAPHPILIKALSCLTTETHLLRFVVLGRPGLEAHFLNVSMQRHSLLNVSKSVMGNYFEQHFDHVRWEYGRKPNPQTIDQLVNKADGLFIWSSTLCSLLEDKLSCPNPHDTLMAILQSQQSIGDNDILANLYHDAMNLRFPKPDHKAKLKVFLGAVLVLQEPLPIAAFASLTSMEVAVIRTIQGDLGPLQTGQAQDTQEIVHPASSNFHLSLVEYLQSPDTPTHLSFPIDTFTSHSQLGQVCLEELHRTPAFPYATFVSPLRKYAMKYWPTHIAQGTPAVSPASDVEWRATPHFTLLSGLSVSQWQHWASTYLQPVCTSPVLDPIDDRTPQHFISRVVKSLLHAPVIAASSSDAWLDLGKVYNVAAESNVSSYLIQNAVQACRSAAYLGGDLGHQVLRTLASCLWLRFCRLGSQQDLNEAISLERVVLVLTSPGHPDRALSMNNLAESLLSRFEQTGTIESLDEAIVLCREALSLRPSGHPGRSVSLNNLAYSLNSHYNLTGTADSLDESIVLQREALLLRPPGHPDRALSLDNLASPLLSHFELTGAIESLEEATVLCREALLLRPPGHPRRSVSLNNLASCLSFHVELTGAIESLDEATMLHREALLLRPQGHPDRPLSLHNLASCLHSHFKLMGMADSLEEAIVRGREALSLRPPGHPRRSVSLTNLAYALLAHFKLTGTADSLDEAIMLHREVLLLRPTGHPRRSESLHNLALSLDSHFSLTGAAESLEEAIVLHRESLHLCPPGHRYHTSAFESLAKSLQASYRLTGSAQSQEEALGLLPPATQSMR